jgi:hypothetical protein
VMRRRAGLNTNDAPRQLLEERQYIAALQLAADDHMPCRVNAVNRGSLNSTHIYGTYVPVEEPSTASIADPRGRQAVSSINCPPAGQVKRRTSTE